MVIATPFVSMFAPPDWTTALVKPVMNVAAFAVAVVTRRVPPLKLNRLGVAVLASKSRTMPT